VTPLQAIDASDMRQRSELDQQISIVERRLARYETLVLSGAIARTQLEIRGSSCKVSATGAAARQIAPRTGELIAPVDGIVAEGTAAAGRSPNPMPGSSHVDPARLGGSALDASRVQSAGWPAEQRPTYRFVPGLIRRNQSIPVCPPFRGRGLGRTVVTVLATTDEERPVSPFAGALVRNGNGQTFTSMSRPNASNRARCGRAADGDRVFIATAAAGKRPSFRR
jgi:hypothetical protein